MKGRFSARSGLTDGEGEEMPLIRVAPVPAFTVILQKEKVRSIDNLTSCPNLAVKLVCLHNREPSLAFAIAMKAKVLFLSLLFLSPPVALRADVLPRTAEEFAKMQFKSNLEQIAESEGAQDGVLQAGVIRRILTHHKDKLLGGIDDGPKFATLRKLCQKIAELPEREEVREELFSLFKEAKPLLEEPKNWNEILIKGDGGALGLVSQCLIGSYGEEMHARMLDQLIETDDVVRARVVLERARFVGKEKEIARLVTGRIDSIKSASMRELYREYAAENRGQ